VRWRHIFSLATYPVRLEASLVILRPSDTRRASFGRRTCGSSVAGQFRIQGVWNRGWTHRTLAQHGLSCPRLQSLLRPDPPSLTDSAQLGHAVRAEWVGRLAKPKARLAALPQAVDKQRSGRAAGLRQC